MTSIKYFYLVLILAVLSLEGCMLKQVSKEPAKTEKDNNIAYQNPEKIIPLSKEVAEAIEKRNSLIEKDPRWIDWSYKGLGLTKLNNIPSEKYSDYAKFIDNSSVYIIVHPAYYVFFHNKKPLIKRGRANYLSSIVDLFFKENYDKSVIKVMQMQLRNEKAFIEQMTTENKLVILILPKNSPSHKYYSYTSELDEYARYINEITNASPAALYIESDSSTNGKLSINDLVLLLSFLSKTEVRNLLVGGGYVGRCQDEFYGFISDHSLAFNYYIVPEISSFSPSDLSEKKALTLLDNKKVNMELASEFILDRTGGNTNLQRVSLQFDDYSATEGFCPPDNSTQAIDSLLNFSLAIFSGEEVPPAEKNFSVVQTISE
ncbi:MAG: hypothetical protein A2X59_00800 [Nitrospirae bacterium GWC2_42_7]|nr:MAG: hypothetical protein A2X59_00800 [Nitrospirae bacterium GWC2_42_7]